jgi:glutamate synthase (NADPH) small chain
MGKPTGFLEIDRQDRGYAEAGARSELQGIRAAAAARRAAQAGGALHELRHPVLPQRLSGEQHDPGLERPGLRDDWREALETLHSTNNFPEFTGRICPAPCEAACTLNIDRQAGHHQIDRMRDRRSRLGGRLDQAAGAGAKTGKRVAVVGSGPAGLACAQQLARAGHSVTVFEKADRIGGLLRYGIPDFKMEKHLIDRRMVQMEAEGVIFRTGVEVGVDVSFKSLRENYDAIVLAGGAENGRATCPSRAPSCKGVHFAMEFLTAAEQARRRRRRSRAPRRAARSRQGQARHRDRRRRHRLGLRRHLQPPGRASSPSSRSCRSRPRRRTRR